MLVSDGGQNKVQALEPLGSGAARSTTRDSPRTVMRLPALRSDANRRTLERQAGPIALVQDAQELPPDLAGRANDADVEAVSHSNQPSAELHSIPLLTPEG